MKQVIIKNERKQIIHSKKIKFIIIFIILMISFQQSVFATLTPTAEDYLKHPEDLKNASDISSFMWIIDVEESDLNSTQKTNFKKCLEYALNNSVVKNDDSGVKGKIEKKYSEIYGGTVSTPSTSTTVQSDNGKLNYIVQKYLDDPSLINSMNPNEISSEVAAIAGTTKEALGSQKNINKFIEVLEYLSKKSILQNGIYRSELLAIQELLNNMKNDWGLTSKQKNKVKEIEKNITQMQENSEENQEISGVGGEQVEEEPANNRIFRWPNTVDVGRTTDGTLQDMINDAGNFLSAGTDEKIEQEDLNSLSGSLYNILLEIGVGISVILGLILGIKMMLAGVEEKAEVKKMMWIYLVGCIVVFGSFGIWKIVVTILEQI